MIPRRQRRGAHFFRHEKSAHGHAAAQALRRGHDVGLHTVFLPRVHISRPAHAALDLVQNQKRAPLVAESPHALQEILLSRQHAALPLNRLQQNRAGFLRHGRLHALQIIQIRKPDISDHGLKGLSVLGISRHGKGSHCSAVEGTVHGNDLMIRGSVLQIRVLSGRLDSPLDGLRPGIGEKNPVHAGKLLELFCRVYGRDIVIIVRGMDQLIDLRL